jgi:BRCA1-associated protein
VLIRGREKAERRAEKAVELSRGLQASLSSERAMTEGLSVRVKKLEGDLEGEKMGRLEKAEEVKGLEETVRDLMVSLDFAGRVREGGGEDEGVGGDLVIVPGGVKGKKKGKKA